MAVVVVALRCDALRCVALCCGGCGCGCVVFWLCCIGLCCVALRYHEFCVCVVDFVLFVAGFVIKFQVLCSCCGFRVRVSRFVLVLWVL